MQFLSTTIEAAVNSLMTSIMRFDISLDGTLSIFVTFVCLFDRVK